MILFGVCYCAVYDDDDYDDDDHDGDDDDDDGDVEVCFVQCYD